MVRIAYSFDGLLMAPPRVLPICSVVIVCGPGRVVIMAYGYKIIIHIPKVVISLGHHIITSHQPRLNLSDSNCSFSWHDQALNGPRRFSKTTKNTLAHHNTQSLRHRGQETNCLAQNITTMMMRDPSDWIEIDDEHTNRDYIARWPHGVLDISAILLVAASS